MVRLPIGGDEPRAMEMSPHQTQGDRESRGRSMSRFGVTGTRDTQQRLKCSSRRNLNHKRGVPLDPWEELNMMEVQVLEA